MPINATNAPNVPFIPQYGNNSRNAFNQATGLQLQGSGENTLLARLFMAGLIPQLTQGLELGEMLAPQRARLAAQMMNRESIQARGTNQAFSNASRAAQQGQALNQSAGLGSGYQSGANQAAMNSAASQGNDLFRWLNSPEWAMQMDQMIQQMSTPAAFNMFATLLGTPPPVPRPPSNTGLGSWLGPVLGAAGQFAGMGGFGGDGRQMAPPGWGWMGNIRL